MAGGPKYQCMFDDDSGKTCIITITYPAYDGSTIEVDAGEDPIVIKYLNEGDPRFEHIKASEATITLLSTSSLMFLELFTKTQKFWTVDVSVDGSNIWSGYINPDNYTEPLSPPPYIVTVKATDGIANLKNIKFTNKPLLGSSTHLLNAGYFISLILDNLRDIPFDIMNDLWFTDSNGDIQTDRIISKIYFDYRAFRDDKGDFWTLYDIFVEILTTMNARFIQDFGRWRIERLDAKRDTFNLDSYANTVTYSGNDPAKDDRQTLTSTSGSPVLRFINDPAMVEVALPYKNITVHQDYGIRANFLPLNNFDGKIFSDEFASTNTAYNFTKEDCDIAFESDYHAIRIIQYQLGELDSTKRITTGDIDLADLGVIDFDGFMDAWANQDIVLKFKFSVAAKKTIRNNTENLESNVWLDVNFTGEFYSLDEVNIGESGDGNFKERPTVYLIGVYPPRDEWKDIEITIRRPPEAEITRTQTYIKFNLRILQGWGSDDAGWTEDGIMYSNLSLNFEKNFKTTLDGGTDVSYDRTFSQYISEDNMTVPDTYEVKFGETPPMWGTDGYQLINRNVIFDSYGVPINQAWGVTSEVGTGVHHNLIQTVILLDLWTSYKQSMFKIRGTLVDRGHLIKPTTCLVDYDNRNYIWIGMDHSVKHCTWQGEWLQIYTEDTSVAGEFNDDFSNDFWI